jgi:hypothetical protein
VDVGGGLVGQRPVALVRVFDARHPRLAQSQGGVAAAAGLDRGVLVGADRELALAWRLALPGSVIQI